VACGWPVSVANNDIVAASRHRRASENRENEEIEGINIGRMNLEMKRGGGGEMENDDGAGGGAARRSWRSIAARLAAGGGIGNVGGSKTIDSKKYISSYAGYLAASNHIAATRA